MKKIIFGFLVAAAMLPALAKANGAENARLGGGVTIGEPLDLNARSFFTEKFAGDLTAGYGFSELRDRPQDRRRHHRWEERERGRSAALSPRGRGGPQEQPL